MNRSSIYTALLVSFAGISTTHAASVTQNIVENYGATNIVPTQRCEDLNYGPSNFCIANINPEGLSLKPGHELKVITPVSFPAASWWGVDSPTDVKLYGADEKRYDCTRIEGNQWSCILPNVGFHSGGLRVYLGVDNWRAGWGGMLTVDDLQQDVPLQDCIDRSIQLVEQWKNQAVDSYRYTAEKLHLALDGVPTKPYQDVIDENALILDILHTCALQPDTVPALLKPMPEKPKHD